MQSPICFHKKVLTK